MELVKVLFLDGPNRGTIIHVPDLNSHALKVLDPEEPRNIAYPQNIKDLDASLKVNTYHRVPLHPFAEAYGFGALFRFSHSNK